MTEPLPTCLDDLLRGHAERFADRIAIDSVDHPGDGLTYAALWLMVRSTTRKLRQAGVGPGDCVAVVLPNGPEMAITFLAIAAGATCAPLNPGYREQEFDFYLADLNPRAIVLPAGTDSPALAVARARGIPVLWLPSILERETNAGAEEEEYPGCSADDVALVLHTSGTTSRPKIVPLTQRNLLASARNIGTVLALAPEDTCLNIMPLFHIHGLIGALLSSVCAGARIVCTPGFYAPRFFEWMEQVQPTWYTAVPTMHQAILSRAAASDLQSPGASLRLIRSSSSALPPQVMQELESLFGCPVIESYGMTEASHQMASNPLPPRARKPGSVGVAAGPEITILDAAGDRVPPHGVGEVAIRGENIFTGYVSNPEANHSAFVNGWFRTGDQGYLNDEGYLYLTGRLKELINRGGEKIAPREIDEALLDHPAVAQAVTFAVPHDRLGEEIAAAVVLKPGIRVTESELRAATARRLADFKVPARVLILDEIPKGPTGKVQRIGLAERLGLPPIMTATLEVRDFVAAETPVERALEEIWSQILGVSPISVHDRFLQIGGDSVLAAQIVARVRQTLDIELTLLQFFETPTIAGLAPVVEDLLLADLEAP